MKSIYVWQRIAAPKYWARALHPTTLARVVDIVPRPEQKFFRSRWCDKEEDYKKKWVKEFAFELTFGDGTKEVFSSFDYLLVPGV